MNQQNKRKRRILRSVQIDEVSGVDHPAQEGAGAVLMKNQGTNMNDNPEDVIRDALAVRDDGQEPKYAANDYEQAILHEARLENSATETFAQVLARVASNGNDHVDALVFASQRVRDRDAAMGKAAPAAPSPITLDAERVAKGSSPAYRRDAYEDEMCEIASKASRPGESMAASFARLAGDGAFDALWKAAETAEVAEVESAMAKGVSRDERFDRLLLDMAKMRRAPGETLEQAASRLLTTDRTIMDAYAAVSGH